MRQHEGMFKCSDIHLNSFHVSQGLKVYMKSFMEDLSSERSRRKGDGRDILRASSGYKDQRRQKGGNIEQLKTGEVDSQRL